MSKAIAIYWNDSQLAFVVADDGTVEALDSIAVDAKLDAATLGKRLSDALEPYAPARFKTIVALGRESLEWQHLSLPPCPADELPELVRMQADREFSGGDEDVGFDYLSLAGDEKTAHQVLTVSIDSDRLATIREACQTANLALERIVPLASGWPSIAQQTSSGASLGTQVLVAPEDKSATLWATRAGRVVLVRQFQLAASAEPELRTTAVVNELRRTLLSLSQHEDRGNPQVALLGEQTESLAALAQSLNDQLGLAAAVHDVAADLPTLPTHNTSAPMLPLAGLAIDETLAVEPLVDLLHPHQRSKAEINVRTYSLAAIAGVLFLALLTWTGYARLQAPLKQAAADRAELQLLAESLDDLQVFEAKAAAIRNWESEAPNLLLHLQQLSKSFRPQALDEQKFPTDQDVLLEKLDLNKRQLTIDALARNSQAVQPLEARLRESAYRPQRGKSDPSEIVKEYPWHFKSTIEITSASDPASSPPEEEPKS
ncbi:MAG: hypothetical protein ACR2NM_16785 [Bythopirellula sp.]